MLPGIRELIGRDLSVEQVCRAVRQEFTRQTGWQLAPDSFTEAERQRVAALVAERYTQDAWNRKR
jgi:lipoate-protein ligase A